jgi:hypothetical protein
MKKITFLLILLTMSFGFAQNLITNGSFDTSDDWNVVNLRTDDFGTASIGGGVVTFADNGDTGSGERNRAIYQEIVLTAGFYAFDMYVEIDGLADSWGEVFVGTSAPVAGSDYSENNILVAWNTWWGCVPATYQGIATALGCSDSATFEITTDGTYYVVFKAGSLSTYGNNIIVDNVTLINANPPVPLTEFDFDFSTPTPIGTYQATFEDDAINTVTDGINSTTEVGEISGVNDDWYSQFNYEYSDGFDLSTGDRGISLKVKGPRTSSVKIKVESGTDPDAEVTVDYTTPNVWQELIFDLTGNTSSNNSKVAVFFDFETNFDAGVDPTQNIFQVDDFVFGAFATLSSKDFVIEGLTTYPNPTNSAWNISTKNQVIKSIEVFNILGKQVISLKPNAVSTMVDASNLAPGLYITNITTEQGIATKKLIKQ